MSQKLMLFTQKGTNCQRMWMIKMMTVLVMVVLAMNMKTVSMEIHLKMGILSQV